MKQNHKDEIADLVRDNNQKFNDMLQKRLAAEDTLMEKLKEAESDAAEQRRLLGVKSKSLNDAEFAIVELRSDIAEKDGLLSGC